MSTPLKLKLPTLSHGHLYQLIHQAEIRKSPLASLLQYQILLYFIEKSPKGLFKKPCGTAIPHWVEVGDAFDCVRGSLWTDKGEPVSNGRKYSDEVTKKKYAVLNDTRTFKIGAEPLVAVRFGDIFPPDVAPLGSFLDTVPDTRVLVTMVAGETVIIPCFEILRTFYYQQEDALTNHFFSNEPLSAICRAVVLPSQNNNFTAHIELYDSRFSERQSAILAEMSLNAAYRRSVETAHSRLLEMISSDTEQSETHLHLDFHVGRDFEVRINGFKFEANDIPYFFACGLWPMENPFCFEALVVHLVNDPRQGPTSDEQSIKDTDTVSGGTRLKPDMSENPPLDSGNPGNSRYQGAIIDPGKRSGAVWPEVSIGRKKRTTLHQPTAYNYVTETPESLSQTGGGLDEKVAKTSKPKEPKKERDLSCSEYFRQVIDLFRAEKNTDIKLLTVNNDEEEHGRNLSVLTEENPKCIHIASIKAPKGYFYFFQLVRGGRALFVHKTNPTQMTEEEIKGLLKLFIAGNLNWSLTKKSYIEAEEKDYTLKYDPDRFVLYPRNYSNGTPVCAELCKKVIAGMPHMSSTFTQN